MRTKGKNSSGRLLSAAQFREGLRSLILGAHYVRIPSSVANHGVNGTHLLTSYRGDIKVFNTDRSLVFTYTSQQKRDFLLMAREQLANHLPVVAMLPGEDHGEIVEPLLQGQALSDLQADDLTSVYRRLIAIFTECEIYGDKSGYGLSQAATVVSAALSETRGLPLNHVLASRSEEIISLLAASPSLPAHCDLTTQNVFVVEGQPIVIDLEFFAHVPFFYDALTVPFTEATHDRWRLAYQLNQGEFDHEFEQMFKSAAMGSFRQDKLVVWLAYLVLHLAVDSYLRSSKTTANPHHIERLCSILKDPRFGLLGEGFS